MKTALPLQPAYGRLEAAEWREVFFAASVGLCLLDPTDRVLAANAEWLQFAGLLSEQVLGRLIWELLPDRSDETRRIHEAVRAGEARELPPRCQRIGGREVWYRRRLAPIALEQGVGILVTAVDVTASRSAHATAPPEGSEPASTAETLKQSLTLLKAISDAVPDPLFVKDHAGRMVFANPATFAATGKTAKEIIGYTDAEWMEVPEHARAVMANDRDVMNSGKVRVVEEWMNTPVGPHLFLSTKAPRVNERGEVIGLLGLSRDISDRKRAEEALRLSEAQLRAANAALSDADRRKDEFLATLSHELRNPLSPIRSAAQILTSPQANGTQIAWASAVIQRQVKHMTSLLDDLLDVARITQGKLELKFDRVVLSDIVEAAIESSKPLIDSKHHSLVVELPDQMPLAYCDPVRLSQVLSNLLINAAKYSEPHGHIRLAAHVEAGQLVLSVKDEGIGIPPEALDEIFTIFSQLRGSNERSEGGLGIGLSLVKGLVTMHGGRVEARSGGPGKGSEFIVTLPLPAGDIERSEASPTRTAVAARTSRVMIADDNRDAAESLAVLLRLRGFEVRTALNGEQALALAQVFRPDVALLDIGMPQLDGHAVARRIRQERWGKRITLVALTGLGTTEDRKRTGSAGFDLHLTKPVDLEQLIATLTERRR